MMVQPFYDNLASRYHLVYEDWEGSIVRQAAELDAILREFLPGVTRILDVAAGVGTQSLGLSALGYEVMASDLSSVAVRRAKGEAANRRLDVPLFVADFSQLPIATGCVPLILCGDNSLPHLLSADAILSALREWRRCLLPGGACVVSMRDYGEPPEAGTVETRPYGQRIWRGRSYSVQQVWTWTGPHYEVAMEMTSLDPTLESLPVLRSTYFAIPPARVLELMTKAGFEGVMRLDGRFFQPVLMGFVPTACPAA